ncbi:uncharacterized protein LOC135200599 [Macrobrachium nipponense]|uniref:uncharacterized protein LOC135200599 n=1 Tax=Macrobrachium nipponense TaxID=159736 RepID=UPI0030C7B431
MLGNKCCLLKAVPVVILTTISFISVCYDLENVFLRNHATTIDDRSSINQTRNAVRIKTFGRDQKYRHCKDLFSIDSPASKEKIEYVYSEKIPPSETVGRALQRKVDVNGEEPAKGVYRKINDVLWKIRKLKYSEPERYLGEEYQPLAGLLPRVVDYDSSSKYEFQSKEESNYSGNEPTHKSHQMKKSVKQRTSSRIVEGTLPFVPCSIRDYEDRRQVFTCFQKRIDVKGSLSIHFFGDSKIRYLLHLFLEQYDDVFHFVTTAKNITRPWREAKADLMTTDKWTDIEIFIPALPRLGITLSFRKFQDSPVFLGDIPEIQQLRKWANLEEQPPDLLIIDYTAWTLGRYNIFGLFPPRNTVDVFAILLELHAKVIPLLQKISKITRVLLLPQSRQRPNADNMFPNSRGSTADFNMDWSESTFLYILQYSHDQDMKSLLESHLAKARELLKISDYQVQSFAWTSLHSREETSDIRNPVHETKKASYPAQSTASRFPVSEVDRFPTRHPRLTQPKLLEEASSETTEFRDYLIPSTEDSGLWFWDAILPLNLAEIQECEEMVEGGMSGQPLYQSNVLRCYDPTHAGDVTNSDLITMMLNLLCNTVLGTSDDYCCS